MIFGLSDDIVEEKRISSGHTQRVEIQVVPAYRRSGSHSNDSGSSQNLQIIESVLLANVLTDNVVRFLQLAKFARDRCLELLQPDTVYAHPLRARDIMYVARRQILSKIPHDGTIHVTYDRLFEVDRLPRYLSLIDVSSHKLIDAIL